ncbi:PREDICTED: uncharacterized protein LOC104607779 isoform X1 [Nelumbo nucifera]|uniref:Uncharacterized protein LOC104607779 isoform X1 n=2 Tax=Nelumbo nucifera TaxID=4432 RepID=A0A1U8AUL6_NELNU|nr:PREDICTED: uncharacterized protein LOC104607779 isoform X1 [Nelumbo nucifera]DAD41432.1 TPA_asm: hypothetical protein HUJ06_015755 [Nelumbo nucifera]
MTQNPSTLLSTRFQLSNPLTLVSRHYLNCDGVQIRPRRTIFVCSVAHSHPAIKMKYMKSINLFHDLLKSNTAGKGRLLGLDVGLKYVGLAVSDPYNKIASPLSVLVRKKSNIDLMAKDFQSLISEFSLVGFVVGYPFDYQRNTPDAVQVKLFIEDLRKIGKLEDVKYTYWDERFTSKCVELLLKPLNLHPVESKTILDKFAAVGILQGYLDYVNMNLKLEKEVNDT